MHASVRPTEAPSGDARSHLFDHAPTLFRLAVRLTGSAPDAEDIVHDVFVKALAHFKAGSFRGDSSLLTWLYRATTNLSLDRLRSLKRRQHEVAPEPPTAGSPEAGVLLKELSEALAELPDDQRAAMVLKELQGLSTRETALVLERSEGATEQLLVRARATLRRRFEP